jgi:5-methylcytosine-specific restriction endonuclease McrA
MYLLSELPDDDLLESFAAVVAQDRRTTAQLLAHIAEIDARHLYLRAGFESMKAYCMATLHLSEDSAKKRLQVARLARVFPILFTAIAEGRLHLTAARLLAPRLNSENVDQLVDAASGRTETQIEFLIAEMFPQPDDGICTQVVVRQGGPENRGAARHPVRTRLNPVSADIVNLEVSLPHTAHDKLRRAQALLGHDVPSVARVLERALDVLLRQLEVRKFGSGKARKTRSSSRPRGIPAQVRNAVYKRDQGRCVFRYPDGSRCGSTTRLEFDHIVPISRGGRSTVANLRILFRAHNQFEAERQFGREFVEVRRRESPAK